MAKRMSNLARTNLLLIPAVVAAVGAGLVTTSPAQAAPVPRGDIVAKKNGEDEDAFVQLRPTSGYTDKGTGRSSRSSSGLSIHVCGEPG